jgi:hypothetical protein
MAIRNDGKIGIGTNTPETNFGTLLHVHNPGSSSQVVVTNSQQGGGVAVGCEGASGRGYIWNYESDGAVYIGVGDDPYHIGLHVDSSGRVGMGTQSPAYQLHVAGNAHVTGTFTAGDKQFLIDHPLDPDSQDLVHASVEAPRYDLIYRGQATLEYGETCVSIDAASGMTEGTFAALTRNPQVWVQNNDTWDLVKAEVVDGEVQITSNNPESSATIDWMVVAERNDPYIRWHDGTDEEGRLIVERQKANLTEEDQEALRDRTDEEATEDRDEVVDAVIGKRGYPRHPEAIGREKPRRVVRGGKRKA